MKAHCSITGKPINDLSEGIWDDGDWISWEYIHSLDPDFRSADFEAGEEEPDKKEYLDALVSLLRRYHDQYGRYLSFWGELGEMYAEVQYGLKLHPPYTPGSDGRIGQDMIEVKTISPMKTEPVVHVKRKGNFNVLVVVKIDENLNFESRWVERRHLKDKTGKTATYHWEDPEDGK